MWWKLDFRWNIGQNKTKQRFLRVNTTSLFLREKKRPDGSHFFRGEDGIWTHATLLTSYSLSRGAPSASWVLLLALITVPLSTLKYLTGARRFIIFECGNLTVPAFNGECGIRTHGPLRDHWFSRPAPSTTRPTLLIHVSDPVSHTAGLEHAMIIVSWGILIVKFFLRSKKIIPINSISNLLKSL